MLRIRPYKSCDAEKISEWIKDEDVFVKWGGDHFGEFPITAGIIDDKYRQSNGDCKELDNNATNPVFGCIIRMIKVRLRQRR